MYEFNLRSSLGGKFLLIPIAYMLLVRGFNKYWLNNDLRFLYKEILKPYHKRIDDNHCIDYRDIKQELESNTVNQDKSMIAKLKNVVE